MTSLPLGKEIQLPLLRAVNKKVIVTTELTIQYNTILET